MNRWTSETYRTNAAYVPALGAAVLELLHPRPGERILDLGCGEGSLTERIAAAGAAIRSVLARRRRKTNIHRFYATPAEYSARLESHGFSVRQIDLIPRPTPLPTGIRGWLETFERSTLDGISAAERESFIAEVEDLLREEICDSAGNWTAHYVRLRFLATTNH